MRLALTSVLVLALGACSSDDAPTGAAGTSRVAFQFSGDTTGSFLSAGTITSPSAATLSGSSASAVVRDAYPEPFDNMLVFGWMPASAGKFNGLVVVSPQVSGVFGMKWGGAPAVSDGLAWADITFYLGTQLGDTLQGQFYRMESGTLTMTEVSASRVVGTFSGTGHLYTGNSPDLGRAITLTNGQIEITAPGAVVERSSSIGAALCTVTKLC